VPASGAVQLQRRRKRRAEVVDIGSWRGERGRRGNENSVGGAL
jgi:hypothetical protein